MTNSQRLQAAIFHRWLSEYNAQNAEAPQGSRGPWGAHFNPSRATKPI